MAQPEVLNLVHELADYLREHTEEAESLGKLPDETAKRLKEAGVVRMLQPRQWGGLESHPAQFFEAVMAVANYCGASGWVCGIVGVHPWEMALCDPKLQEEIWAEDANTWIASPYAPMGRAKPVDGGWSFNGRWEFSSGTDHCDWIFLGGMETDETGAVNAQSRQMHFVLPRSDYEIVEGSWNVVGLKGTGSKDIIVRDAFIPSYRAVGSEQVIDGTAAREAGRNEPLFLMPWSAVFPNAITAAVIGICEGGLAACLDYQRTRSRVSGESLAAIGEAASEVHASRVQLVDNVSRMFDLISSGREVPLPLRAQGRRDQVKGSWRAVAAMDEAFARTGGGSLRMEKPIQRFWRDAHAGLNHAINVPGGVYRTYVLTEMGESVDGAFI